MCLLRYPAIRHSPSQRPAKRGLLKLAVMVRFDSETIWHRAPPGGEECVVSQSPNFMLFCKEEPGGRSRGGGSDSQLPVMKA